MGEKIRIYLRLTLEIEEVEPQFGLPLPLSFIIVSSIWLWVRMGLHMPAETPLFSDKYWIFGDGLAIALGVAGILLVLLWVKDLVLRVIKWFQDTF